MKLSRAAAFLIISLLGARPAAALSAPVPAPTPAQSVSVAEWTWPLVAGATSYRVLSSTGGDISGELSAAATSFSLTGLSTNTATVIQVEAFGSSVTVSAQSTAYTAAAQPTGTAGLGTKVNTFSLEWNANGNPSSTTYDVSWSTAYNQTMFTFSTAPVAASSASASVPGLPTAQTIYFMVRARNGAGVVTPFDAIISTFIPSLFGQPAITSGTYALGISSISWFWTASTGAVSYQLFGSSASGSGAVSPVIPVSSVTQPAQISYVQTGLAQNTVYTDFVSAFDSVNSTNSAAFARCTLAGPTSGLNITSQSTAAASVSLAWYANGNPAYTQYNVLWWSNVTATQTVIVSTPATSATVTGLPGGGTIYFTVQARNLDGIPTAFDSTFYSVASSTYYAAVGSQTITVNGSGVQTFLMPSGVVNLFITSNTFHTPVALQVSVPAPGIVPAVSGGGLSALGAPVNLQIFALDSFGAAQQPASAVRLSYQFANGSLGGLDLNALALARYDTSHNLWVALPTFKNRNTLTLTALTDHFSLFSVVAVAPPGDLSSISVGPNPLRPTLVPGAVMTFRNLPAGARVRIFNYTGELLAGVEADASGMTAWDGRNRAGNPVASGVYLALIESGGTRKTLRVAVER